MKLVSLEGIGATGQQGSTCKPERDNLTYYMDAQQVMMWGYIPTQQFLEQNQIPYHQESSEGETKFVVNTPGGEMTMPTIIDQQMAQRIKEIFALAKDKAVVAVEQLQSRFNWWWLVVGAFVLYAVFGGKRKEG